MTDQNPEGKFQALEKYAKDLTELARRGKLDPVIGRDEEIRRVIQVFSRRTKNNPVLIGEPGVGKSRLIEEFHARLREVPHSWAEWTCSQLLQNTPLHPLAEWGRIRFGGAEVPPEQRLADLESSLAQVKLDPA